MLIPHLGLIRTFNVNPEILQNNPINVGTRKNVSRDPLSQSFRGSFLFETNVKWMTLLECQSKV